MTINSVANMAATAFTREGFVTGKAAAAIDGNGAVAVISEPAPAALLPVRRPDQATPKAGPRPRWTGRRN
jgi:MspA